MAMRLEQKCHAVLEIKEVLTLTGEKSLQSQEWCILCRGSEVNGASSLRFKPVVLHPMAGAYTGHYQGHCISSRGIEMQWASAQ